MSHELTTPPKVGWQPSSGFEGVEGRGREREREREREKREREREREEREREQTIHIKYGQKILKEYETWLKL